ncbi:hypothetical protein TSOC_007324 [Tetrabaena socialis]|uniref:UVR domain-containing protein n=1 Tax=Tetrabaena socialis TaxID=47790 RepID=A0A2J8A1A6_9CHLO|nr:hypothetical protein TSOC_007324 [Tetrabaena socialis]|eukprot:PNH06309.1 hypothetical protein TSOC_007324 [Tetrabaena socialis]
MTVTHAKPRNGKRRRRGEEVMFTLQKDLAVKEERFEDAREMQQPIYHEMTHNRMLRLVVAMESALADGRYEEAARLRDECKHLASGVRV